MARQGDTGAAISAWENGLLVAEDENLRSNLAILYYQEGSYSDAVRHLRVLVGQHPENPGYHYDLAVNLVDRFRNTDDKALEDLFEALGEYEMANGLSPGFSNSVNNIAVLKKVLKIDR